MTTSGRVVLDTNVIVSFFLNDQSTPARAVQEVLTRRRLVVTEATRSEVETVLRRPKFDRYVSTAIREAFLHRLASVAIKVAVTERIRICSDPNDDKFLEAAVSGSASFLVTGDRALLALHPFRSIEIVTPANYLRRVGLSP